MDKILYNPVLTGIRIKTVRKKYNMTQESLAEALNVSIDSVSKYENGKVTCGYDYIIKLCQMFNISADYFLFGIEKPLSTKLKDNDIKIAKLLTELDEFDKERAYLMLDLLFKKKPAA